MEVLNDMIAINSIEVVRIFLHKIKVIDFTEHYFHIFKIISIVLALFVILFVITWYILRVFLPYIKEKAHGSIGKFTHHKAY